MKVPNRAKLQVWCKDQEIIRFVELLGNGGSSVPRRGDIVGVIGDQADLIAYISGSIATHVAQPDPHPQYLLEADAALNFAPIAHTHPLSALTQSGATLGQYPTWNGTAWVAGGASGAATITMGQDLFTVVQTVAAIGVTPANIIMCGLGAFTDDDDNSAELLDLAALNGVAGTDQITFTASFSTPTAGEIRINWSAL